MRRKHERGQVLVEFALALGFALTLFFGIIDFGRAVFAYSAVTSAAQAGTRYAIVRGSSCTASGCPINGDDIRTYVQGKSAGIDPSLMNVTTTWSPDANAGCSASASATPPTYNAPGCLVSVRVDYSFRFLLLPNVGIPMSTTSQMVISQ